MKVRLLKGKKKYIYEIPKDINELNISRYVRLKKLTEEIEETIQQWKRILRLKVN